MLPCYLVQARLALVAAFLHAYPGPFLRTIAAKSRHDGSPVLLCILGDQVGEKVISTSEECFTARMGFTRS